MHVVDGDSLRLLIITTSIITLHTPPTLTSLLLRPDSYNITQHTSSYTLLLLGQTLLSRHCGAHRENETLTPQQISFHNFTSTTRYPSSKLLDPISYIVLSPRFRSESSPRQLVSLRPSRTLCLCLSTSRTISPQTTAVPSDTPTPAHCTLVLDRVFYS